MKVFDGNWKAFATRTVVFGVVVFGAVRLAVARPGVTGGPARSSVTVAGTVTGLSGMPTPRATFHFHRPSSDAGAATDLCAPQVNLMLREGGVFSVEVPLDTMESPCPETMFDGSDVQVDVDLPGALGVVRNANVNPVPYAHFASVAGVARQYETSDCPAGYNRDTTDGTILSAMRLCVRTIAGGRDEVVRVGAGATSFWVDRYEATIWNVAGDRQFNARVGTDLDVFGLLPRNGEWRGQEPPLLARSSVGRDRPARWVTWFQAEALCRASGKRLPTSNEWLAASRGTGGTMGDAGCWTAGTEPRDIAAGATCVSDWGARDMVGNVWEWTAEWMGSVGSARASSTLQNGEGWPATLGRGDIVANVVSLTWSRNDLDTAAALRYGLPSAISRGGSFQNIASAAGALATNANNSPMFMDEDIGFRCVIPR